MKYWVISVFLCLFSANLWSMPPGGGAIESGQSIPLSDLMDSNDPLPTQKVVHPLIVEKYLNKLKAGENVAAVTVLRSKQGDYIMDGHHRFVASKILGIRIPVTIIPVDGNVVGNGWASVRWESFLPQ